jgi:hypothetical protein
MRSVFARVTAAFRSLNFCTTMFCLSSSESESVFSRYRCTACSLASPRVLIDKRSRQRTRDNR